MKITIEHAVREAGDLSGMSVEAQRMLIATTGQRLKDQHRYNFFERWFDEKVAAWPEQYTPDPTEYAT